MNQVPQGVFNTHEKRETYPETPREGKCAIGEGGIEGGTGFSEGGMKSQVDTEKREGGPMQKKTSLEGKTRKESVKRERGAGGNQEKKGLGKKAPT